jgi:hypothetical protein
VVSVVRHASGVEDSFLSRPPKGVEERFSNPILHHRVFTPNKERERERNKERGIRSRRNLTIGAFVSSDVTRACAYISRAGKICPNFCGEEEKRRRRQNFSKSIFLGASLLLHEFCISLSVSLSLCECMFYYEGVCKVPCSYRQPGGRGQVLSRRYCKHSGCLYLYAPRTESSSQGAFAASCKYFKQSKWPFWAATSHANTLY